ncbi:MAG: DUF333 domain-containing protein [Oligoflexia bacterium]|nr:DUF333 domain-containing protein [Oligoflexia bacterium]
MAIKTIYFMLVILMFAYSIEVFSQREKLNKNVPIQEKFVIEQKVVAFNNFSKEHILISMNCGIHLSKMKCQAYKQLSNSSMKNLPAALFQGGPNPGAVICVNKLKGTVVIGSDTYGENSFCKFSDGSIVDNGTISYYATSENKLGIEN